MSIITEEYGKLLSTKEVARRWTERVHGQKEYTQAAVWQAVKQGRLTPKRKEGRSLYFLPSDVESVPLSPTEGRPKSEFINIDESPESSDKKLDSIMIS